MEIVKATLSRRPDRELDSSVFRRSRAPGFVSVLGQVAAIGIAVIAVLAMASQAEASITGTGGGTLEIRRDRGEFTVDPWTHSIEFESQAGTKVQLRWTLPEPAGYGATIEIRAEGGAIVSTLTLPASRTVKTQRLTAASLTSLPPGNAFSFQLTMSDGSAVPHRTNKVFASKLANPQEPDALLWSWLFLDSVRETYRTPALAGAIVPSAEPTRVWYGGIRKNGDPTKVTKQDLWHIGSDTKAMTATLIGILVQKGLLNWESRIWNIFPEYQLSMNDRFKTTTLRILAAHRSGLLMTPGEFALSYRTDWASPSQARNLLLQRLLNRKHYMGTTDKPLNVESPVGLFWRYGHGNYLILAAVIEKVTGKTYEQAMKDELFTPLGITTAEFGIPTNAPAINAPYGHQEIKGNIQVLDGEAFSAPAWHASGGCHLTLSDWGKFLRLHLNGTEGSLTLHPATFRSLHTPYPDVSGEGIHYGWGWGLRSLDPVTKVAKRLDHCGSTTNNFCCAVVHVDRGYAVMAATNIAGDDDDPATVPDEEVGDGDKAVGALMQHLNAGAYSNYVQFTPPGVSSVLSDPIAICNAPPAYLLPPLSVADGSGKYERAGISITERPIGAIQPSQWTQTLSRRLQALRLDTRLADWNEDPDHDGSNNLQEYGDGTDPLNRSSHSSPDFVMQPTAEGHELRLRTPRSALTQVERSIESSEELILWTDATLQLRLRSISDAELSYAIPVDFAKNRQQVHYRVRSTLPSQRQ